MHCLANIYVGRAPLGRRAKLEIDALPPSSSFSLPSPSHTCPSPGGLASAVLGLHLAMPGDGKAANLAYLASLTPNRSQLGVWDGACAVLVIAGWGRLWFGGGRGEGG